MTAPTKMHSEYHLLRTTDEGVKMYGMWCVLCGKIDIRGLPRFSSPGMYFAYPLPCIHCKKNSRYYNGNRNGKEAWKAKGTGQDAPRPR